ncbi:hypothetical protein PO185_05810 [Limosilactobacillus mucosae]|uniref:hypothetical protein n=1 Tax=Limosilactobacillus mucosae TaxID=97478 RepID=UPI00233E5D65|nr:hypothetical protein [Limosilactobacillus mucosae]MDC2845179.1 hypothetical protein [Limosilactobacillus mucosae]
MALNKDQLQLIDWYNSGYGRVALRHGLTEQTMREWLLEQGYYNSEPDLADRMLREFRAELIGYELSCLDPIQAAVWLLLLSDKDKDHDQTAEQINTVSFDIAYNIAELADVDGTGLHQVAMTIIDDTGLEHEQIMDYIDQRLADLSANESKLLELLSSTQQQPRAYYYAVIDTFRALN